jgi:hypothetical protein
MNTSKYILNELFDPTDNRHWKLHWFEELTMNQQTAEPLIEALFVPLVRADLDLDRNPPELLNNDSYDFSASKKIEVGGGLLPILHIGLLLHQGRPVKRPVYQRRVFNLSIREDTTRVLPLRHSRKTGPDEWEYDIDFDEYDLRGTNLFVRCLHIDVPPWHSDGIIKVIIPCAEVIRFYYGNSSELFHEILTNGLAGEPNRVFDPSKTVRPGDEGRTAFVQLSAYVKKEDAPVIARFAFSRYALAQAKHIYLSAQINSKRPYRGRGPQPQGRVPEAMLPYIDGETKLVVHGRTIASGPERYFLVYYIESDSAPFPFQYFDYDQDGDEGTHVVTDQSLPDAGRSVRSGEQEQEEEEDVVTVNDEVEELIIRTDKAPSPGKEQVKELLWQDKFPDLNNKNWRRREREGGTRTQPPRHEPKFIQGHDDTEELSTAPPGSGGNKVTPLSFVFDFNTKAEEEVLEDVPDTGITPSPEKLTVDETVEEKPKEVQPRHVAEREKALTASYKLFADLVELLDSVLPEKMRCEFVKIPVSGNVIERKRVLSSFPIESDGQCLPWATVIRDDEVGPRHVVAARGICHGEHYFYLMEIEPPVHEGDKIEAEGRQYNPRTYTLLLIHYDGRNFADMSAEDLRQVLVTCARNRGSWLKKGQFEDFGRYKFKHTSKSPQVFVTRIIEYLMAVKLLTLESGELAEVLQRLRASMDGEQSRVEQSAQNEGQAQGGEPTEDAHKNVVSPEGEQPAQISEGDELPQTDESTVSEETPDSP